MSEFRRPRPEDTFVWPSATWEAGFVAMLREVAAMFGGALGVDGGPRVIDGLFATIDGRMVTVTPGLGMAKGDGVWRPIVNAVAIEGECEAHDSQPRIDVVSLAWSVEPDAQQLLGRTGNTLPANTYTQAGCVCEVVVTKGTPSAEPVAPYTPSGQLKVAEVYVPANSGALTPFDGRRFASGPARRDVSEYLTWYRTRDSASDTARLLQVYDTEAGGSSYMDWLSPLDYPIFSRGLTALIDGGERGGTFYPMLIPGGRTWWRTFALGGPAVVAYQNGGTGDVSVAMNGSHTLIKRESANTCNGSIMVTLPVDVRGLEITNIRLRGAGAEAWTGSTSLTFTVGHGLAGHVVSGYSLPTSEVDIDLDKDDFGGDFTPIIVARGMCLFVGWNVVGGGDGLLRLDDVLIEFREGRQ